MNQPMIYVCIPSTPERRPRLAKCIEAIHKNKFPHTVCVYESMGEGSVYSLHRLIEGINGIVAWLDDDCEIAEDYLEKMYTGLITAFPDLSGAAYGYDPIHIDKLAGRPMCHADLLKKYVHKGYFSWYADTEFDAVLRREGKLIWVPEAKTVHNHFLLDKSVKYDETYDITQRMSSKDGQLFQERLKNNFKNNE